MVRHGVIARADLQLFHFADTPTGALEILTRGLAPEMGAVTPAFARSTTPAPRAQTPPPEPPPGPAAGGTP